jgi:uncharacterized protein (TIGR02646 family)
MIYRDRSQVPSPEILTSAKGRGLLEMAKAKKFYATKVAKSKRRAFKFECYRSPEVKRALEDLFFGKCAYCESRYAGTQPVDVEHWRPKAAIVDGEETIEPGYYWLAADWDNLLPSCIDCNRERGQMLLPGRDERNAGKANRFPLEPGSMRARAAEDLAAERPLLLHPCHDQPEEHLEFLLEGVVRSRRQISSGPSPKGESSIEIYALNRTGLVHSRLEIMLILKHRMYTIERLLDILESKNAGETVKAIADHLLGHEMAGLSRFREPDQPYSQMARQVIDAFLEALMR